MVNGDTVSIDIEYYGATVTVKGIYSDTPECYFVNQYVPTGGYLEDVTFWIGNTCINNLISKKADDEIYTKAMEAL